MVPRRVAAVALLLSACSAPAPEPKKAEVPKAPVKPPESYRVRFDTTRGPFVVEVRREWAPNGADHFHRLVEARFYDGAKFFRVVRSFVAQFGVNGDVKTNQLWGSVAIPDDPVKLSNRKGTIAFAKIGPNSRRTQVFVNLRDNRALDKDGFAAFGRVAEGMETVEKLWSSYGETANRGGAGPDPTRIELEGNAYLDRHFPRLDAIAKATVVQ
jgi:peptidyl-prolyl cis-trans isomerase A (cyclophilin A)